ncbi:unnamed protein product [Phytophthora fragariaefolia]|uniref:Unnamed protein product n=1 Tax=Phytophthora fragariaefolia TaxID=1490495 RepID=A0A9W6X063_9STRA|nr:unnamed protein product [Phytophthora fragariaefolia]
MRAKPANAKSAERKGRDASSQNKKSKKTPKHRGSSDKSDSHSSSGSSDQDPDHSDSSSFEDVVPNVPTVAGPGGTMFTFRPYVNARALDDFDEKAALGVRTRWLERFQSIAVQGGWTDKVKIYEMKLKLSAAFRNWLILERMEAKYKTYQVPFSGSSRTQDGGPLRMESFDQHPDHPVSKTEIAPRSVNAAMISDILLRAAGPTSSVTAVAARGTLLDYAEFDPARSVRSFMKTNVEEVSSSEDTRSSRYTGSTVRHPRLTSGWER